MEMRPRYLIVAALAILASVPAVPIGPALAQDANPVFIRASAPRTRSGRVPVNVKVSKSRVRVGEWVMVNLTPPAGVERPLFRVNFGDGREDLTRNRQIDHKYGRVGHYDVRAWVEAESPRLRPVPRVFLSVAPNATPVGKPVAFSAQLAGSYPGIKYRFVFGDRSQTAWLDQPQTTHAYALADTFNAYVDIGAEEDGIFKVVGRSGRELVRVNDQSRDSVSLAANPSTVEVGRRVTFNARANSPDSNLSYRFVFGDGSVVDWQRSSQATHDYASPNTYEAYVQIRSSAVSRLITSSARTAIRVIPPPTPLATPRPNSSLAPSPRSSPAPSPGSSPSSSPDSSPTPAASSSPSISPDGSASSSPIPPKSITDPAPSPNFRNLIQSDWWKYLLVVLLISFVGYRVFKMLFTPRPTFRAVPDAGGSDVDEGKNALAINAQILFSPDIADGLYRVSTTEANLVRSIRSEND